jgi:hypothetical protein
MVVQRLSGTTSLLPNNLIIFNEKQEFIPVVATSNAVMIGEKNRIKIESGEIVGLLKLSKNRFVIVTDIKILLYQMIFNGKSFSCVSTWSPADISPDEKITACGGCESTDKIFVALRNLSICSLSANTFSISLDTKVCGQHKSEICSISSSSTGMVSCDTSGFVEFWKVTSSIPSPLWNYNINDDVLNVVDFALCCAVNKEYIIVGTVLGKLIVINNGIKINEIFGHRGSVSSVDIKQDDKVDPNVACSVGEDGTCLTFTSSGIKFKHSLIENAMLTGVKWTGNDQLLVAAYGRDYVITEKV